MLNFVERPLHFFGTQLALADDRPRKYATTTEASAPMPAMM